MQTRTHVHMRAYLEKIDSVDVAEATILLACGYSLYGLHTSIFEAEYPQRYGYFLPRAKERQWLALVDEFALRVMGITE